jgi:hypothetical protein
MLICNHTHLLNYPLSRRNHGAISLTIFARETSTPRRRGLTVLGRYIHSCDSAGLSKAGDRITGLIPPRALRDSRGRKHHLCQRLGAPDQAQSKYPSFLVYWKFQKTPLSSANRLIGKTDKSLDGDVKMSRTTLTLRTERTGRLTSPFLPQKKQIPI